MNFVDFFRDMSIRNKILSAFMLMFIMLIVAAYVGYRGISQVKHRVDRTNETNLLVKSINEIRQQEKNLIIYGNESYISSVDREIQFILNQARTSKEKFKHADNKDQMDTVISATLKYQEAFHSYVNSEERKNKDMQNIRTDAEDVLKTIEEFYIQQMDQLTSDIKTGMNIAQVQDRITNADDANQMLMWFWEARTIEKEYIISGEQSWYDSHESMVNKTLDLAKDVKAQLRKEVNLVMINNVIDKLNMYQGNWHDFVNTMKIQEQVENEMRIFAQNAEKKCEEALADQQEEMQKQISVATILLLSIIMITIIFAIIIAFLLAASISNPLKNITDIVVKIGEGDLRVEMPASERSDEIGVLSDAFRSTLDNLKNQIKNITEAVNILTSMVAEIIATSSQLTTSSTETVSAITETTTTVEEVKQTAQVTNEKAKTVTEESKKTLQVARDGEKAVNETNDGMILIKEKMGFIAESIMRLSEQSQSIGEIMNSINDLAEQSNLLAVNASIEAAKAGEEGKGFGVVAEEVKSLADQSKQATQQVREILTDIQKATSTAVMATEEGSKVVESGIKQADNAGGSIKVLAEVINEAVQATTQIGVSVQQQFVGIDQITEAIRNISVASNQNLESTKQLEEASEKLDGLAENLGKLVEQYQV
jgi:methyl-accepting chemotaxis protein